MFVRFLWFSSVARGKCYCYIFTIFSFPAKEKLGEEGKNRGKHKTERSEARKRGK
jgi:hypothetical protein